MSDLTEKIAREHRLVGNEDGSVWCEGEGKAFEPDDAARHVAEVTEAAVREHVVSAILDWGQQYIMATRSEPGRLHWTCDHDFPGGTCDTCFTNAGHAAQVTARIARGGAS